MSLFHRLHIINIFEYNRIPATIQVDVRMWITICHLVLSRFSIHQAAGLDGSSKNISLPNNK